MLVGNWPSFDGDIVDDMTVIGKNRAYQQNGQTSMVGFKSNRTT
jgi:hypothetical protein